MQPDSEDEVIEAEEDEVIEAEEDKAEEGSNQSDPSDIWSNSEDSDSDSRANVNGVRRAAARVAQLDPTAAAARNPYQAPPKE